MITLRGARGCFAENVEEKEALEPNSIPLQNIPRMTDRVGAISCVVVKLKQVAVLKLFFSSSSTWSRPEGPRRDLWPLEAGLCVGAAASGREEAQWDCEATGAAQTSLQTPASGVIHEVSALRLQPGLVITESVPCSRSGLPMRGAPGGGRAPAHTGAGRTAGTAEAKNWIEDCY